eukprot:1156447-Pelagomonas_calceolata.AAC.1
MPLNIALVSVLLPEHQQHLPGFSTRSCKQACFASGRPCSAKDCNAALQGTKQKAQGKVNNMRARTHNTHT